MSSLQLNTIQTEEKEVRNDINKLSDLNIKLRNENIILHNNIDNTTTLINNYYQAEDERNFLINNELNKYNYLKNQEVSILTQLNNYSNISLWRYKDKFYYRPNTNNDEIIIGKKEEVATEIGSRYSSNIQIVDDLNQVRFQNINKIGMYTTYIAINSIPVIEEEIFDINNCSQILFNYGRYFRNIFQYTPYLIKRFRNPYPNLNETKSFIIFLLNNLTTIKDSQFISKWIAEYYTSLRSCQNNLVLIGNKELSEEILWRKIINPIFGHKYCLTIDEEILKNKSIEDILSNKLFFNINYIPDNKEDLLKLEEIIKSILLQSYSKPNYKPIRVYGQIIITLDSPHPFIKKFINWSKIFFLKSMEEIKEILHVKDGIGLYKEIENSLHIFSDDLNSYRGLCLNPIDEKTSNEEFIELLVESNETELTKLNTLPILDPFEDNFYTLLPKEERYKHTYITGQSGSGKSELLKTLLIKDIERNDISIILLDPHGDLALDLAKMVKDKERLILIDPSLDASKTPTINLFELENKSKENVIKVSKMISSVIKSINSDENFSGSMEDVIDNCIPILLRKESSDFFELHRFMNDNRNTELVELGKRSPSNLEKEFFQDEFKSSKQSRDAVKRRVKKLLNDSIFSNLMNGKNTINLEKEMNTKGKIIIFRIPKSKMLDTYKYYAKFILGLIQIIALKRADSPEISRVHTHLYIDEFHNFITPTIEEILTESRKYKLFLNLAHQSISQLKSSDLKDIILSNTNVKIIGNNSNKTLEAINKTLNQKLEDVEKLQVGEFYIKAGNKDLIKVKNSERLLDNKEDINSEKWNESIEYQLENYYRNIIEETEDLTSKIDEFIEAILLKDNSYFEKINESDKTLYEELVYNLGDENGFIAQPLLSKYFNEVQGKVHFKTNKDFLNILKEKNSFFNQDLDKNKTYKSKKRYQL